MPLIFSRFFALRAITSCLCRCYMNEMLIDERICTVAYVRRRRHAASSILRRLPPARRLDDYDVFASPGYATLMPISL